MGRIKPDITQRSDFGIGALLRQLAFIYSLTVLCVAAAVLLALWMSSPTWPGASSTAPGLFLERV